MEGNNPNPQRVNTNWRNEGAPNWDPWTAQQQNPDAWQGGSGGGGGYNSYDVPLGGINPQAFFARPDSTEAAQLFLASQGLSNTGRVLNPSALQSPPPQPYGDPSPSPDQLLLQRLIEEKHREHAQQQQQQAVAAATLVREYQALQAQAEAQAQAHNILAEKTAAAAAVAVAAANAAAASNSTLHGILEAKRLQQAGFMDAWPSGPGAGESTAEASSRGAPAPASYRPLRLSIQPTQAQLDAQRLASAVQSPGSGWPGGSYGPFSQPLAPHGHPGPGQALPQPQVPRRGKRGSLPPPLYRNLASDKGDGAADRKFDSAPGDQTAVRGDVPGGGRANLVDSRDGSAAAKAAARRSKALTRKEQREAERLKDPEYVDWFFEGSAAAPQRQTRAFTRVYVDSNVWVPLYEDQVQEAKAAALAASGDEEAAAAAEAELKASLAAAAAAAYDAAVEAGLVDKLELQLQLHQQLSLSQGNDDAPPAGAGPGAAKAD